MGPPGHAPYASFSEDQILAVYNVFNLMPGCLR